MIKFASDAKNTGVNRGATPLAVAVAIGAALGVPGLAQRGGMFLGSANDPAIAYSTAPVSNAVDELNQKLQDGRAQLTFDGRSGYLRSALDALGLATDAQLLVFSKTSLQQRRISAANPRAIYFNDRLALGWVRDGDVIEVAAHDRQQGVVFYTLEQQRDTPPAFHRQFMCLSCHQAGDTLGVPGFLMFSTDNPSAADTRPPSIAMDHRSPIRDRWAGWYVTGRSGSAVHHGNQTGSAAARSSRDLASLHGWFDADGYQSLSSDIAALLVFSHQTHMTNLLTRAGWEARAADPLRHAPFVAGPGELDRVRDMMAAVATEVVDYMLFVDEAPLPDRIVGANGFAARFSLAGPRDGKGRSLHQLDLNRRLVTYPCSYLIYSDAFDALPQAAKDPIYQRLWDVLSGAERGERYRRALSAGDRQAILEILRDTKPDLPAYFHGRRTA